MAEYLHHDALINALSKQQSGRSVPGIVDSHHGEESEMPDAEWETRACPYCKEEVKVAAVRCTHCLADIPPGPDHGGVCSLCQEEIKADAIRCQHCKATLVPGVGSVFAGPVADHEAAPSRRSR